MAIAVFMRTLRRRVRSGNRRRNQQHDRVALSERGEAMRRARVEMRRVARLQRVPFVFENQVQPARNHVQPFLALVLVEFVVMPAPPDSHLPPLHASPPATPPPPP